MGSTKKLYIFIGGLILVVSIIFLAWFFTREKLSQIEKGKPTVFLCSEQLTYQGDVYNTVQIGEQCWLAENLRTTIYRDGTPIPHLTDSAEWEKDKQGGYVCYYNLFQNCQDYGGLYNWYAINNEKGLCPEGWSVSTDEQWTEAENYELRAVFGGFRNFAGPFDFLGERGFWWITTASGDSALARVMEKDDEEIRKIESSKSSGFSVRCVKNE